MLEILIDIAPAVALLGLFVVFFLQIVSGQLMGPPRLSVATTVLIAALTGCWANFIDEKWVALGLSITSLLASMIAVGLIGRGQRKHAD